MFQNPISKPSSQKSRKNIITQKVLVTQSPYIVHCDWHTQEPICAVSKLFKHIFPVKFDIFYWKVYLTSGQLDPIWYCCWPPDASTRWVHLTACQPDPKVDQMSSWPDILLLLVTRCLYWGYIWAQVNWTQISSTLGHNMPVLGVHLT